jgi:hypothetical protein
MNHKRTWLAGAACLLACLTAAQAKALMIAPPPIALRPGPADLIVTGKVTGFGSKLVKGEMYKGDVRDMQVATIKVGDTLLGKQAKEIKVGFFPPMNTQGGGPRIIRRGPTVQLRQDEEYCLLLIKHPTQKDVYVAMNYYDAIGKKDNPNFAKEVEAIKKSAKLIAKPMDGLKSKQAEERLTTAALLITRYRTNRTGAQKTEQVSADESKLVLEALAEADWKPKNPRAGFQMNPQTLFFNLGVTEKDGWKQPKDFNKLAEEAKKWCKDNAGKYRINRFVSETKEESK